MDRPPRPFVYDPPPPGPLPVLHADRHILVLDKPAGLLTVPGRAANHADCLEARARAEYPSARIVHRLDMDTSGVIVLALRHDALVDIGRQFERRLTGKAYVAVVQGEMVATHGRVDQPLITDWPNRPKQHVDAENGRAAVTDYRVIERAAGRTRVGLLPLTGRSHQLRVHMAWLGHPILGDNLYADAAALAASDRLCLHAERLEFSHPESGARVCFETPAPF
ncbi:pseudouridine synthase [Maricaulis sp. CAU 1757]